MLSFKLGNKTIGKDQKTFIIAELSGNHGQKFEIAIKTLEAIKKSGADAVKLQTYTPDTITINSHNKYFSINDGSVWNGKNLYNLYQEAYTPWEWQPKLKKYAEKVGLIFFSSVFDKSAVDFLEKMNVPAYKIASMEITDLPLIEYVARKKKPIIISTGIATHNDIRDAIRTCRKTGNNQIAVLKCTSAYPTPLTELNLKLIPDFEKKFKVVSGISDHTMGSTVSIAACALGAKIVEKHFILDRKIGGPDSSFSMEPTEFKQMVQAIRDVEKALGTVSYKLTQSAKVARWNARSLFAVKDIKKGQVFTEKNVRSIRPANGLPPKLYKKILGKKSIRDIEFGTPLSLKMIKNFHFN